MAEQTKHDNAAVFSDMDVSDRCIATMQYDGALWTIGHCRGNGLIDWAQGIDLSVARGLCSALADALGVELHPAGTAAKMQELAKERDEAEVVRSDLRRLLAENAELRQEAAENASDKKESLKCIRRLSASISRVRRDRIDYDRVRAEVPECEGLTDVQIDWIANTIRSADILSLEQKSSCNKLVRDLTDWNSTAMTARGREVLAAIEACRVTEAEPTLTESADGRREWLLHGKLHREDGPAIELPNGYREWWLNGKLHREDGPAIEWPNGYREWRLHGKRHREDGPAIEWPDGRREWWLNGVRQPEPDKGGRQ